MAPPTGPVPIVLTPDERPILERWARGRRVPRRLVRRARIVLQAVAGRSNAAIARALRTDRECVGHWRARFATQRLAGLQHDAPRPGRPSVIPDAVLHALGTLLTTSVAPGGRPWSCRSLAREAGVSPATIHRLCQATGLTPHWGTTVRLRGPFSGLARLTEVLGGTAPPWTAPWSSAGTRSARGGRPCPRCSGRPRGRLPCRPAMPSTWRRPSGWSPGPPRRIGSPTGSSSWPTWPPGFPGGGGSTSLRITR